jgi:hypothetical protein
MHYLATPLGIGGQNHFGRNESSDCILCTTDNISSELIELKESSLHLFAVFKWSSLSMLHQYGYPHPLPPPLSNWQLSLCVYVGIDIVDNRERPLGYVIYNTNSEKTRMSTKITYVLLLLVFYILPTCAQSQLQSWLGWVGNVWSQSCDRGLQRQRCEN